MWVVLIISGVWATDLLFVRIILFIVGTGVTIHLVRIILRRFKTIVDVNSVGRIQAVGGALKGRSLENVVQVLQTLQNVRLVDRRRDCFIEKVEAGFHFGPSQAVRSGVQHGHGVENADRRQELVRARVLDAIVHVDEQSVVSEQ